MANLILIEELQSHFIANGLVRAPNTTGALPICWLHPREGAPQPSLQRNPDGSFVPGETATVTLAMMGGTPPGPFESELEERIVDVYVRARSSPEAEQLHQQMRFLIEDKRNFFIGRLHCQWCYLFTFNSPLGADEYTYDSQAQFRIAYTTVSLTV